ncbi:unnamed protein product [Phytophthora fragariaefolia]|uniref:Unnamed protein product n=1 Tax=Phytophthora fragariaefolia TaxID=1490495 RepID=A0A9W6UBC6_9STRA|nr:unnamed protein product [Phytophthora fragariaefolia]
MPITTALQNAQQHRRELYAFPKRNGLNIRWKMKTQMMESIVAPFKQAKASKIVTAFKKAKRSTDKSYLDVINQSNGKVNISLSRFNRIRKQERCQILLISQTMFNSGATVDFIRKTAKAFNICISVKQFRIDQKPGRAKNDTTVYGDKRNTMLILSSVGEHLFAIAPTNITKGAPDNPN